MKKLYISICLMLASLITFSQWNWQNPLPQGNTLLSTYFTSPDVGYTVGEHGTILKTTDGGISWNQQISGTNNSLNSVFFTSVDTGYIAGGYSGELILKTTNGGNSWETQYIDSTLPSSLNSIFFLNSNLGFAVGYNGTILKTIDGGTTWTPKFSGTTEFLVSVFFTDINTGYVVGTNGIILKTTNAGNSWTSQTSGTLASLCSVFFTDPNTGYISASTQILKTTNGGITWTPYSVGTTYGIGTIYFTDLNTGYAVSATNIYKTTNAGLTWSAQNTVTTNWLKSVFFADNNIGYSVGEYGTIIKTTDSGINWNSLSIGTTKNLCSVFFTDNYTGYTVGANGVILKTINGGSNWIEKTSGTMDTLRSVYFVNSNIGFAVGNSGTIIKTNDAGNTWITQTTGVFYNLYSVFMIDSNTGYAVGKGGMIVKTADGGSTWDPISFNVYGDLTSVYFTDANTGCAVGVYGKIIKTTNGGNTWTVLSGSSSDFNSVYFTDSNRGYIVGTGGEILKTTDGGDSWTTNLYGTNYWLYSVHFKDSLTGYAVGCGNTGGVIIKTTDGGNSWNEESLFAFSAILTSVYVTNNGCYAVGFYGTILSNAIIPTCNVSFQSFVSPSGNVDFTTTATVSDSLAYPITYTWSFGDGTSATTNFDTISHFYNSSGFVACVTMQTANGCSNTFCDTISINPTNQCQTNFYYYADSLNVPPMTTYNFVDQSIPDSTSTIVSWNWTFPGGTPATSILQSPQGIIFTSPGTYTVCLTTATSSGCTSSYCEAITISINPPLNISLIPNNDSLPCGVCNSMVTSVVTGGVGPPYTFLWNDTLLGSSGVINNLCAGTYSVTVTDAMLNTVVGTVTISQLTTLFATLTSQNPTIIGGNDGYIESSVSGGTPPYVYSWNTGQTTPNIYNLTSGLYLLNVTDANGCTNSFTAQLYEPYDTTGGPIVDTLITDILDTCLNFVPDSFYISTVIIDSLNNTATVTWVFVGGGTTSTFTVVYQYFVSGNNAIVLTIDCGNKTLTSYMSFIHISASVGIESVDFEKQDMLAYPVPFSDLLNINFTLNKTGIVNIYLLDATGRIVSNKTIEATNGPNSSELNTSNLPSGYYILNVENNGQILRKPVVK